MLLFIKKDIKYKLVDISLFTDSVPQEVIACEVVTNNGNSLIIACVYRSPGSTADNNNSLNRTFRALAERYYSNLVVLGELILDVSVLSPLGKSDIYSLKCKLDVT